jgi:hypothetical protein
VSVYLSRGTCSVSDLCMAVSGSAVCVKCNAMRCP